MEDTYAYISQRGRQFVVRIMDHHGQLVDSYEADTLRAVAAWRADYHPGANLAGANLVGADLARADLDGANLVGANLDGANLDGACLAGTDLIDGGQEKRGFRFWAWRRVDGAIVIRGGCREWIGFEAARAHYSDDYKSDGDRAECLARIELVAAAAKARGWA